MLNSLKYSKELEDFGLTREQADKSVNLLQEIMEQNLASKQDIKELESKFSLEIQQLKTDIIQATNNLHLMHIKDIAELKYEIKSSDQRLLVGIAAMLTAAISIFTVITKLL